ncbi:Cys/Met metabolism pyridoxal-phosphate-dependent protein [Neobacillus bataviensis LMG 21833]|uniref:Cys/Met metabolism pyridoxal-phosphate-dependent protein n=1 Tax=Neobacillus bataviensis LMG 21833 TaxID=1117379 RepID=K6CG64_9BACI|nr:Cys/Met metabolism pyridoxal-phosphate-dependent protein [Neobacillus bataviensis LMG 21833]
MNVFKVGVSWGSFKSLIISPDLGDNEDKLTIEHISPGLIRIAVGLENAKDSTLFQRYWKFQLDLPSLQ